MLPPLFETAKGYNLDPLDVLFALVELQNEERSTLSEIIEARQAAREATGLTLKRLQAWEDAGKDHTTWKTPGKFGLDVVARELAAMYPALGIGEGYGEGVDKDYAPLLWELLREPDPAMRDAVELLDDAAICVARVEKYNAVPF